MIGTAGTCWHCFLPDEYIDEVSGELLCRQHAGALAEHPQDCTCETTRTINNHSVERAA